MVCIVDIHLLHSHISVAGDINSDCTRRMVIQVSIGHCKVESRIPKSCYGANRTNGQKGLTVEYLKLQDITLGPVAICIAGPDRVLIDAVRHVCIDVIPLILWSLVHGDIYVSSPR